MIFINLTVKYWKKIRESILYLDIFGYIIKSAAGVPLRTKVRSLTERPALIGGF